MEAQDVPGCVGKTRELVWVNALAQLQIHLLEKAGRRYARGEKEKRKSKADRIAVKTDLGQASYVPHEASKQQVGGEGSGGM
eukprot:76212-Rhodomonas_salina.2